MIAWDRGAIVDHEFVKIYILALKEYLYLAHLSEYIHRLQTASYTEAGSCLKLKKTYFRLNSEPNFRKAVIFGDLDK